MRSRLAFIAAALNGVPSWNCTPFLSLNVHVSPSLDTVHSLASSGTILPSSVMETRPS